MRTSLLIRVPVLVLLVSLVAGAALAVGQPGSARPNGGAGTIKALDAVTPGSGWDDFGWDGPTLPVPIDENPFTFECAGSCTLRITDTFICGDYFEIRDGGDVIGTTPVPSCTGDPQISDPDAAYADPRFSHASLLLGSGAHSIELFLIGGYYDGDAYSGGAYLRVDAAALPAAVPALSPMMVGTLVALLGVAGLFAMRRFV